MQQYIAETKPLTKMIEGLFERVYVANPRQKQQFLREDTLELETGRYLFALSEAKKSNATLERVLKVLTFNTKNVQADLKNKVENSNNEVIKDILKAKGNIGSIPMIGKVSRLLTISVATNDRHLSSLNFKSTLTDDLRDRMRVYNKAATDILMLIEMVNRNSGKFKTLIKQESGKPYSEQFYNQLFVNICLFVQIYSNALYASSVEVDRTLLTTMNSLSVGRVGLEMKNSSSPITLMYVYNRSLMDEPMSIINTMRNELSTGRIFNHKEVGVVETFMGHVNDEALNEGFLDVLSGLLTTTGIGQFLLTPVYFVRSVTYLLLYLGSVYSNISASIDKSLNMLSSKKPVTASEFAAYKKDAEAIAITSVNQLNNSQMAIKHEIDRSPEAIRGINNPETQSTVMASTASFI